MTPEEQENLVGELETALDRLQALYNQYFMGIERIEPTVQHKDVVRKMQALRREKMSNTALRFRFQTQVQKYSTQSNYWKRICRQIEEGTYQRDLNRASKRVERRDDAQAAARAFKAFDLDAGAGPVSAPVDAGLELDDPFSDAPPPPSKPAPAPAHADPDKTPVPVVGSGIHAVNERLIRKARAGVEEDDEGDLSEFFSKRPSLPPPPAAPSAAPKPAAPSAAPKPAARAQAKPAAQAQAKPAAQAQAKPAAQAQAKPAAQAAQAAPSLPRPSPKPQASAEKRPAPQAKAAAPGALSDDRMQAIYRAYVTARKKTNEPTDNLSYAKVAALLKKQATEKPGVTDFKVVIRDGKAIIKTVKE